MSLKKEAEDIYQEYLNLIEYRMGNQITSQHELNDYMKTYHPEIRYYGAFTPDKVTEIPGMEVDSCMILNTEMLGEHWTAVYKFLDGRYLHYDSFGRPFSKLYKNWITKEMKKDLKIKNTEDDVEQDLFGITEMNCGQRCIAFILVCYNYGYKYARWI